MTAVNQQLIVLYVYGNPLPEPSISPWQTGYTPLAEVLGIDHYDVEAAHSLAKGMMKWLESI